MFRYISLESNKASVFLFSAPFSDVLLCKSCLVGTTKTIVFFFREFVASSSYQSTTLP